MGMETAGGKNEEDWDTEMKSENKLAGRVIEARSRCRLGISGGGEY